MSTVTHPIILLVLDGWGYSESTQYNAIHSASKPAWDGLWGLYPHTLLSCSGIDVGLPDKQMGNSEVGHMHIGGGRVIDQDFTRISRAIESGSFKENELLLANFRKAAANNRAVHLMGLLSPGGVHSHEDHIVATIEMAAECGVKDIYLHAFLDGRDTAPKSAADSIQRVYNKFLELGVGRIASLVGRFYAMDRNKNWDRIELAYDLVVSGQAEYESSDPFIAVDMAYERGETDEFVQPTVIVPRDGEPAHMQNGDIVLFMNYRADRARQLSEALFRNEFNEFERREHPQLGEFISLTEYSASYDIPAAFPPERLQNVFGEYIAERGLKQLRIAETEKYAHVTFFFNGGEERAFEGEDRILIPSPHVKTYDEKPEMSAYAVTDRLVESIYSRKYDAIICNYANADMVGHTGDFIAAVKAVEAVDKCLGRVIGAAHATGAELLITADHGNAERMRSISTKMDRGQPYTAHTSNPVPLLYMGRHAEVLNEGSLADIAPTMLYLLGMEIPEEMSGRSLVKLDALEESERIHRNAPPTRLTRLLG